MCEPVVIGEILARLVPHAKIRDDPVRHHAGSRSADVGHKHILDRMQRDLARVLCRETLLRNRPARVLEIVGQLEFGVFRQDVAEIGKVLVVENVAVLVQKLVDLNDDGGVVGVRETSAG